MTGWKPIITAIREIGRPLLLYPRPGAGRELQSDKPLLDLSDFAVRRMIKLAKKRGYITYGELEQVLSVGDFTPEQIEDVLSQLSEMGITAIEAEDEKSLPVPIKREKPSTSQPEPMAIYVSVFEGCWDGSGWRTSNGSPCKPTHWMPMPAPPLTLVGQ